MTKKEFLSSFFLRMNERQIKYFVIGEYSQLPYETGNSDLDISVPCRQIDEVLGIIKSLAQKDVHLVSFYENEDSKFLRLLTTIWGVQIDIYYRGLLYCNQEYFPMKYLLNHTVLYKGITVLDYEYSLYVNYIKEIIHNGKAKDKYINGFLSYILKSQEKTRDELSTIYGKAFSNIIFNNLSSQGLSNTFLIQKRVLEKSVLKYVVIKKVLSKLSSIVRFINKRPGYVIVVEGTDGSGKSTIINHITPILNEGFHNFVFYSHLRPKAIPDLGVLLGKKTADEAEHVNSNPHQMKQSGFIGSLIRWCYYMIDYTVGYFYKVWIHIHSKSKVFIFDRYYYDYYIDQKRSRTNLPNWIIRFGELLIAKPDIILCLGGDPASIYARKPETSLEEVKRQTKVLKEFCKKHDKAIWIDTTQPIEKSCKDAMSAIYNMMSVRFRENW